MAERESVDFKPWVIQYKRLVIKLYLEKAGPAVRADFPAVDFWQDVHLRALRGEFQPPPESDKIDAARKAWILKIAENRLKNLLRDFHRKPTVVGSDETGSANPLQRVAAHDTPPSRKLRNEERLAKLRAAIKKLPANYREVAERRFLHGEKPAHIATALSKDVATIHQMVKRLKDKLKPLLGPESGYFSG